MLTDDSEFCDDSPKQGNGFEVGSDQEEDYFEEFHLPNSHENAFVRHKSFRRKVHLTPINAPDAEKIEGLVRTGEFQRHGSIRRKMVPEEPSIIIENAENSSKRNQTGNETSMDNDVIGPFAKDLREIESMLNDSEVGDVSDIICDFSNEANRKEMGEGVNQATTSTPKSSTNGSASSGALDCSINCREEISCDESMSIEQSTLMKVRECLDFTRLKDIYVLSGRLQDILTAKEVEEILNNSERYSEYVNKEVIEALHNSLQEQQNLDSNIGEMDSSLSCSKKIIHAEGVDIEKSEASDIRAVIDDSDLPDEEAETSVSKRSSYMFVDDDEAEDDTSFRFERRRSFRLGKEGEKGVEVEGVFVESRSQDIGLKKIKAPTLDLSGNVSEEPSDTSELPTTDISEDPIPANPMTSTSKSEIQPIEPPALLPDIVITVAGENVMQDDDENMYLPQCSAITESDCSIPEVSSPISNASSEQGMWSGLFSQCLYCI